MYIIKVLSVYHYTVGVIYFLTEESIGDGGNELWCFGFGVMQISFDVVAVRVPWSIVGGGGGRVGAQLGRVEQPH